MEIYLKEKIEYWIVLFFIKLVKILPENFTFNTLNISGKIVYLLMTKRRKLAIKNLSLAFKEKDEKEIKLLAKANFLSIARTLAEILLIASKKRTLEDFIEDEDGSLKQYLDATKDEKNNQGVVFITAHFGNWEILANYFAQKGFPMTIIGRRGDNKLIEDNITTPFRESYGNSNVHKSEAMSAMIKTLKVGGRIGILIDQKAGNSGAKTTFFGRDCTTTSSVALMKLKYNPLIVPGFAIRQKSGKSNFIFLDPVEYIADDKENKEEKVKAMTQKYNDIFEEIVRKYPEQWFWMHNRWKI